MAAVRLDSVRKVYANGQIAVAEASFEAADGELLVLVGPSGCGKSTLLRLVAGLESVSAGTLAIGGRVVNDVPPRDRDIAMVFQSYALYPHMSVAQNLAFGLSLRKTPRAEIDARVREAAAMLDLSSVLERKPAQLSGGQRQRVALGRALVRKPSVFLLDEPLSNLDAKLRLGMRVEIARLHKRIGATMIYVTHDQIEAMTLGDRIVVMNGGEIQQIDAPMRLYEKPANVFVAGFLGSPAMNFFRGRVSAANGMQIDLGEASLQLPAASAHALANNAGREILVGVRPEDLVLAGDADADAIEATLEVVEPVGNEIFLNLRRGDQAIVMRVPPRTMPETGTTLRIAMKPERVHLFDAKTERRIEIP
ncbi:MAG TPA: sn-glycerol-3-phosphate ABC transporter ATP-binding protein UgpC [Rhodanobacteraceae bacterium]|nr:sn-glycerol-3-phosphate ABC transporter ATP-binding protein UgpC [Rhodanobacteraceae bacterium]